MATPSAVLLVLLLLLAALTAVLLKVRDPGAAPVATVEAQQQLALTAGRSVGASASQNVADLRTAAAVPATPEKLVTALGANRKWRGLAVLDAGSGALLAARGEPVPGQAGTRAGEATVTPVPGADGGLTLVTVLPLDGGRVLVATSRNRLPDAGVDADPDRAVLLADAAGRIVDSRGAPPGDEETRGLAALAGTAGAGGDQGTMLGRPADGRQTVVSYAPVVLDGMPGDLGLAVVAVARVAVAAGAGDDQGLLPAGALVALALLGFLLIRTVLVAPVLRLRADALAVAGGRLRTKVALPGAREVRRLALALEHCRATLRRTEPVVAPGRSGPSALVAVTLAAAAVLGWSATLLLTVGTGTADVPGAVSTSVRNQTIAVTTAVRRSINDGVADLRAVGALDERGDPAALRPALEQLVSGQARYRSVYLVGARGEVSSVVGREPLRAAAPVAAEAGVALENRSGPVPVLYARAPLPGGASLVGEYDMVALAGLLDRAPGAARVLDPGMRTSVATGGYLAFEEVTDARLRGAAEAARAGTPVAEVRGSGLVVSTAVEGGASSALDWVVVADQPVGDLALAGSELRRNVLTVALVGALLAALLFGWHFLVLVRPLNRVGDTADRIVAGERSVVVYPQHQDEVGTVASCLEICRQALTEGVGRLGEVRRPRGAATDVTELMAALRLADPHPDREPADRGRPRTRQKV